MFCGLQKWSFVLMRKIANCRIFLQLWELANIYSTAWRGSERSQWPGGGGREQLDDEGREGYFHTTAHILHTYKRGMGNSAFVTNPFILLLFKTDFIKWAAAYHLSSSLCTKLVRTRPRARQCPAVSVVGGAADGGRWDAFTAKTMCSPFTDTGAG